MQIAFEVFALEPRMATPPVILRNGNLRLEPSSEEATSQWAVGNKAYTQLPARFQDFTFGIPGPKRVFSLQCGDWMNFAGAADGCGSGFRQPQESYFALTDQISHGADRVFDGRVGIDAMLIVNVDVLQTEPLEARLACLLHILGPSINAQELAIGPTNIPEFCG